MKTLLILSVASMLFVNNKKVSYTVYNAKASQCDSRPLETADGSWIKPKKVSTGEMRWIALSRDLLKKYPYDTKITFCNCSETKYNGTWIVKDKMAARWNNKIDFLVPNNINLGKGTCEIKNIQNGKK